MQFFFLLFRFTDYLIFLLAYWSIPVARFSIFHSLYFFYYLCIFFFNKPALDFTHNSILFQALLLKEGAVLMLTQVLDRSFDSFDVDSKQILDSKYSAKYGFTLLSWCVPVFKAFSLLCNARTPRQYPGKLNL